MDFGIASVAAITVLAYLLGEFVKVTKLDRKWIPVICGTFGLLMGLLAYFIQIPDFPAGDPINAAAVGVVSGLAATGVNQVWKQLRTPSVVIDDDSDEVEDGCEYDDDNCEDDEEITEEP